MLGLTLALMRLASWRRGVTVAALALSLFALQLEVLFPHYRAGRLPPLGVRGAR
jgi:hypothetical protein